MTNQQNSSEHEIRFDSSNQVVAQNIENNHFEEKSQNQKMKNCPACGCVVSKSAKSCPQCGHALKHKGVGCLVALLLPVLVIVVLFVIGTISSNNRNSNDLYNDSVITTYYEPMTEEQYKHVSFPETVRTDCFEIYIEGVYINKDIRPKRSSGRYSYRSADAGNQYCYVQGKIKNISGSSHEISISGDFTFNNTYNYTGLMLKDVENAVDIVTLYESIQPLETVDFYYACSVPDELINNYYSGEVKLNVSTDLFGSTSDAMHDKFYLSFS